MQARTRMLCIYCSDTGVAHSSGRSVVRQDGWARCLLQQVEGCHDDGMLKTSVVWQAKRIAVAKRDEERARRADPLGHLAEQLDGDRCDPLPLQLCCDQAHGLVAEGSDRDQQCDVNAIGYETLRGLGRRLPDEAPRRSDRTHEREMPPVHRADPALRGQLVDAIDRKGDVRIASHARVVERFTAMSVNEGVYIGVGRNIPKRNVPASDGLIEWLLAGSDEAGARYQRQATLSERLGQRRPRHRIDPAPAIGLEK